MYQASPFSDDFQGQESQGTDPQADRQRRSDVDGCAKRDAQISGDVELQAPKNTHAVLPDQLPAHEWKAIDKKIMGCKIEPRQALSVFNYDGPQDPEFTIDEQYTYSCLMKEYRKEFKEFEDLSLERQEALDFFLKPLRHMFSIIAEVLPTRNYKECINYYYRYKGDGRFQNKAWNERAGKSDESYEHHRDEVPTDDNPAPKTSSGRIVKASQKFESYAAPEKDLFPTTKGKASTKAQVSSCDGESPDDRFISSLEGQVSTHMLSQVRRMLNRNVDYPQKVGLRSPNLDKLEPTARDLFRRRPQYMLNWLRSADVLIQLREWLDSVAEVWSSKALSKLLKIYSGPLLIDMMLGVARDMKPNCQADQEFLDNCKMYILSIHNKSRYGPVGEPTLSERLIANVLFWAYGECISDPQGFFGILSNSPLAQLQHYRVRRKLEDLYLLTCELTDCVPSKQEPAPSGPCDAGERDVVLADSQLSDGEQDEEPAKKRAKTKKREEPAKKIVRFMSPGWKPDMRPKLVLGVKKRESPTKKREELTKKKVKFMSPG